MTATPEKPARKSSAKKTASATAKKAPAKKAAASKKPAVPKTAAKKPAVKKPVAKKAPAAKKPAARKISAKKAAAKKPALPPTLDLIRTALLDKKGEDIVILHVAEISSVTDYMVLCTGRNLHHLSAMADELVNRLRHATPSRVPHQRAGARQTEWVVLDYLDIVIHLFTPALRSYYALEQLWKDAPVLPLPAP